MAGWANPVVRRLAHAQAKNSVMCADDQSSSDPADEDKYDVCGLLLICSWPMPEHIMAQASVFCTELRAALPDGAYVYPPSSLHCTISTLRPFSTGPLDAAARETHVQRWLPVLTAARSSPLWPSAPFKLRMNKPTFEGSTGIVRYDDVDNAVSSMRAALRAAVVAAGGVPAEGGADRSNARPLPSTPHAEPAPHIPDIVHSTLLRWAEEPTADVTAISEAFERVAATWVPAEIVVRRVTAVFEDMPFMHIPTEDPSKIWWTCEF